MVYKFIYYDSAISELGMVTRMALIVTTVLWTLNWAYHLYQRSWATCLPEHKCNHGPFSANH